MLTWQLWGRGVACALENPIQVDKGEERVKLLLVRHFPTVR